MKILIIEDEIELLETIKESLEKENYRVEFAQDYSSGLDKIVRFDYSCILLDVGLPGGSGLDILRELKEMKRDDHVIIISAKDAIEDKVLGLELGADDYLTKPFHLAELHARVKSVIRRTSAKGNSFISFGNVKLDLDNRTLFIDETPLDFNRKEFDILSYFLMHPNRLVQKSTLAEHVWGDYMDDADDFEFLYSQIKNVRKKMSQLQANIEIVSVYGLGYKLTQK